VHDPTSLDDLLALLEGEHALTAASVGSSLALYFDALVEPVLDTLAASRDPRHRGALASALGHVERTARRTAVLVQLLNDPHPDVVGEALASCRSNPPPAAVALLRARVAQGTAHHAHVRALAAARDANDLQHLVTATLSHDDALVLAGIEGLERLGQAHADALDALVHALARRWTRHAAAGALESILDNVGLTTMRAALERKKGVVARLERVLPRLEELTPSPLRELVRPPTPVVAAAESPSPPPTSTRALASFGTVIDGTRGEHAVRVGDPTLVAQLARLLTGAERRSVVLVGPSGVGKTNAVHALARHLTKESPGWVVLETSSGEVLVGTKYLGEVETRLRALVEAAKAPAKVVVYFTDLPALAWQGRSSHGETSFADQLAPYLDRGELAILGEATDDGLGRGMDRHDVLRRLFERVRIKEPLPAEAARVVRERLAHAAARDGRSYETGPMVVEQILELGNLYAAGVARPGGAAKLADQVVALRREAGAPSDAPIGSSEVIAALARSTGMPGSLLDDGVPFDRAAVRAFFEERVLGQPEALDVVVELVTLIKAGLTDPDRPYGSLFFVGPTGVGKTEIAKALAEYLYGSPDRMVRVDMSELREWDSYERLIGSARNAEVQGFLTRKVSEQPFSVVLLDEIEKAHSNVHDVLLQLLDDGRLTDPRGRTTDFRRTVIVMTSNVGSRIEMDGVGFGAAGEQAPSEEAVLREVRKVFRPELVNRFGRIVVFRPLSPEVMRVLVRRELGKVVLRSGVLRRRLVIDLAPELVDLLAREGFSIAYGARPLKRRVERRVLLPIAERVVTLGPDAAGTILRAEADGDRIVVRAIVPPAAERKQAPRTAPAEPTWALVRERAAGVVARLRALAEHPRTAEGERRRADLLAQIGRRTFWDDPERARAALTELADLDDRSAARETLEKRIEGVLETTRELTRRRRGSAAHPSGMSETLDEIERDLALLEQRSYVEEPEDRADAIVTVTRLGTSDVGAALVAQLVETYEAFAGAFGATSTRLDETSDGASEVTLHLEGHGVYGALRGEAGLHRMESGRGDERESAVVRVSVLPCPDADLTGVAIARASARDGRARVTLTHGASQSVLEATTPKGAPADVDRQLRAWLHARIAASGRGSRDVLVRRYGVEGKYAADEDTGQRFRMKTFATEGLPEVVAARAKTRLDAARGSV
jgi:ATP-dependent Clp protease ATP-binding subunit ClpC